jgi:hypothetical protein
MEENIIFKFKTITELLSEWFVVDLSLTPYTWDTKLVNDFLAEIALSGPVINDFYSLVRVIVKKQINDDLVEWKLIDGVQCLTTLMILLIFLEKERFAIRFECKESTSRFLECINDLKGQQDWEEIFEDKKEFKNDENFYFWSAYLLIQNWFLNSCCSKELLYDKLMTKMNIIWIEVSDETDLTWFFRLIGHRGIPLTDRERKKACIYGQ